jgi:hypothetical protein
MTIKAQSRTKYKTMYPSLRMNFQIYGSMHYRFPTMHQPQTAAAAAAYNPSAANGMIIYSGATLGRPHMNNNFKRIDSNGICAQQVS